MSSVTRGYSSDGRAPALQAGCQEFESPRLHHFLNFTLMSGVEPQILSFLTLGQLRIAHIFKEFVLGFALFSYKGIQVRCNLKS